MRDLSEIRENTRRVLERLDWTKPLTRPEMEAQLLARNLSVPNEVLESIPANRSYADPDSLLFVVPESAWLEHEQRIEESRGQTSLAEQHERTRRFQVQ